MTGSGEPSLADSLTLEAVTACVANASPPVGIGVVAIQTVALAAGLCESLARTTLSGWADARGVVTQAGHIRFRAVDSVARSARAYGRAREELSASRSGSGASDGNLRAVLLSTADILIAMLETAGDAATLAAVIAPQLSPDLRPDALGAAELAAAAAASLGVLVEVNLALSPEDGRVRQAREIVLKARESAALARNALLA